MRHPVVTGVMGIAAGFSTTTANAAGPVASIYLIVAGLSPLKLLGTAGWFFLAVNLCKVPLVVGLGLISRNALILDAALVPVMGLGAPRFFMRVTSRAFPCCLAKGLLSVVKDS